MTKITSRKSLGIHEVFDIGLEKDHNFLLDNGFIASNCFNKSHSTAYAYITYQTAYLKANYPVEYMAALLTANSDNQDKIEKYRENCQKMGIQVLPPDISLSLKDFTPLENQILFGLSAVRNLGEGAIDSILKARIQLNTKFNSLADFCSNTDSRTVNKRALETLIYSGAFDSVSNNRKQLINDLDLVISWAQKKAKDKESGQLNLFDLITNNADNSNLDLEYEDVPSSPSVEDFSLQDKLKFEKEYLGFYISEHPLRIIEEPVSILSPVSFDEIIVQKAKRNITILSTIAEIKEYTTKKGDQMAFLVLEDTSRHIEGVCFPKSYKKIKNVLTKDSVLIIWGKVDFRDDKVQVIIEHAQDIDSMRIVIIDLSLEQATNKISCHNLKSILSGHAGKNNQTKIPLFIFLQDKGNKKLIRLDESYWPNDEKLVINALNKVEFNSYSISLLEYKK
ncbi:trans-splicing intein-formed DNA polymerase III subunit alpha C-terminal partner DnaE-C [Candidatus Atelocyanobacterium thalassae]|uniref:DNA polymerase III, alpha subunit n=1 Tax=Atelocyanobacterium thalassa (isolate ALOHA) TaxID=1453429 RepID=D3ENR6_ATETH|nr:trans-splicing intein-formed DNA polymerase III subunit alpha C-terminal partner DnaE-C [Candidatus Atelocyanobacterium thalassa]ADB95116.1 DNA polymerase III, alpha subunit [Candidatus Atelocyanobacterium thalassa isolate ALOHA]MCH2543126.1 trans-splicing intein-formed DNA polymerase III subunit alpha C-terminal partner DnaE-C [Candidatus Atelocyanobacterium sp. ALOHA_A2.5_9]|tara:strand:+ start:25666 stop:27018 length:1353 start_codon:yes stop_codon:yes gene_type:complete